jgi:hypothetical protein
MSFTADWDGEDTGFTITDAVAYIDTVGILLPHRLPRDATRALHSQYGDDMVLRPVPDRIGYTQFLILHQPRQLDLAQLAGNFCEPRQGQLVRHSLDFITPTQR